MKSVPFEPLDPSVYRGIVRRALAEDLGWGDVTTEATVDPGLTLAATYAIFLIILLVRPQGLFGRSGR